MDFSMALPAVAIVDLVVVHAKARESRPIGQA
jgi:hypothetical protein